MSAARSVRFAFERALFGALLVAGRVLPRAVLRWTGARLGDLGLGLRDVAVLADVLAGASKAGGDPGASATLEAYLDWRREDHERVIGLTDSLVRLFTNPLAPGRGARAPGLIGLDLIGPAKDLFARQAMGLQGRLPRLARGFPLT